MIQIMQSILHSPTFWGISAPIISGVIAWIMNEKSKRNWENYKRKEERYIRLIENLDGFYAQSSDIHVSKFVNELRLCWLYASDNVISAANNFIVTIHYQSECSDREKLDSIGKLALEIRKDLKNMKTKLSYKDFLHWWPQPVIARKPLG